MSDALARAFAMDGLWFLTLGAFVAGSELLIETLIQQARTWIYTTATPAAVAVATQAALRRVAEDEWRRLHLRELVARSILGR